MPRRTPPSRLADIAEAARKVFTEQGYRRTRMTDVGKELGLSHALLYRFVESKEALFQLAVLGAAVPDRLSELPIPLPTPSPGEVLEPIADWTTGKTAFPLVKAALTTDECEDIRREFHGVIDEYYAAIEDNRALLSLLERSAADIPELGELYFGKPRQGQVDLLAGVLWCVAPDPATSDSSRTAALAAQFIVETVAWFAWHGRPSHADRGRRRVRSTKRARPAGCCAHSRLRRACRSIVWREVHDRLGVRICDGHRTDQRTSLGRRDCRPVRQSWCEAGRTSSDRVEHREDRVPRQVSLPRRSQITW